MTIKSRILLNKRIKLKIRIKITKLRIFKSQKFNKNSSNYKLSKKKLKTNNNNLKFNRI